MPVTLTRRGWGFVVGSAVLAAGWLVVDLRDLWYLVVFLVLVPVLGLATALGMRLWGRTEVRLVVTNPTPHRDDTITIAATIRHRAPCALDAVVLWRHGEGAGRDELHLPRRAQVRVSREWVAARRGPARVGVAQLTVTDPLGVATARVRLRTAHACTDVLVLPRVLDADIADAVAHDPSAPAAAPLAPTRRGQDLGAPGSAVREYRPGDARRAIHWKQSARQGELLVRVREPADPRSHTIELVTDAAAYGPDADAAFERAVSEAATLASHWMRRGAAVQLVFDDGPPIACASEGDMLRRLALVTLSRGNA